MIDSVDSPLPEPTAAGVICVIVDSSVEPGLLTHLHEQVGILPQHCLSLFHQTTYAPLQEAGPYLLVCLGPGALADYAIDVLERNDAGFIGFLPSEQNVERALVHCQQLLSVRTDEHSMRLMRFYEPRWLEPLIAALDDAERETFLGPFSALRWRNELGWRQYSQHVATAADSTLQTPWLHLDAQRIARITKQRLALLAQVLAERYQGFLKVPDPVSVAIAHLQAAQRAGFSDPIALERCLRLSVTQGQAFWERPATMALLERDALTPDEKLDALERL